MAKNAIPRLTGCLASIAASALGFMLTTSAVTAQNYTTLEGVTITAPPRNPYQSIPIAPIKNVSLSREVRFDDLDLRTESGASVLIGRVRVAARVMCRQLDFLYPISTPDTPACYRTSVETAMPQVDAAIGSARAYASLR